MRKPVLIVAGALGAALLVRQCARACRRRGCERPTPTDSGST